MEQDNHVPQVFPDVIGTLAYYQYRHDNFIARNPSILPPSYYLGYGMKYAIRFQEETRKKLSSNGQKWTDEVMVNLQLLMENRLSQPDGVAFERNAQALRKFGFSSHIEAYWNESGEVPLYRLGMSDLVIILFAPDFRDLIRFESLKQIAIVMRKLLMCQLRK